MKTVTETLNLKRRVRGWMMFDWATQPFFTLGLTFIFGPYFAVVAAEAFLNNGMDKDTAAASAQTIWSWGQAIAGIFVAIIGILAGAIVGIVLNIVLIPRYGIVGAAIASTSGLVTWNMCLFVVAVKNIWK